MKMILAVMAVIIVGISGCSSVKIVPEQVEHGTINTADNSQTIARNGVEITANASETAINAYNLEGTVTAFNIAIRNNSPDEVAFAADSFFIVDEKGLQYALLTP